MSLIAIANAFFRAQESERPTNARILVDPWAGKLLRSPWRLRAVWALRPVIPGLGRRLEELQTVHCVRHASVDRLIERALQAGATQVVLLGAGLDARSERFASRFPNVRWFEVDRSPHITHKADTLPGRSQTTRVTADLGGEAWISSLRKAGFDLSRQTVWVAEGLLHYLPNDTVVGILRDIRGLGAQSSVIFTFIRPEVAHQASGVLRRLIGWVGEVPETFFTHEGLERLARELRWGPIEIWDLPRQITGFAPQAAGRPTGPSQDVALLHAPVAETHT